MSFYEPGTRVLISEDCRDGSPATGKYGTLEGDFPFTVSLGYQANENHEIQWANGEFSYEDYKSGKLKNNSGVPANSVFKEWEQGQPQPRPLFAMVMTNPRIRLDDGSVIWGAECWWGPIVEGLTLEQAQKQTEQTKKVLNTLCQALLEKDKEHDSPG